MAVRGYPLRRIAYSGCSSPGSPGPYLPSWSKGGRRLMTLSESSYFSGVTGKMISSQG